MNLSPSEIRDLEKRGARISEQKKDKSRKTAKKVKLPKVPSQFPTLCVRAGLPEPIAEFYFAKPRGYRVDYCFVAEMLALEIEGGAFIEGGGRHNRGASFVDEMTKYNELAIRGYRLLRCTPQEFERGDAIGLVQRALRHA